jgi:hypothetical protein
MKTRAEPWSPVCFQIENMKKKRAETIILGKLKAE